jgi:hypothetical protein
MKLFSILVSLITIASARPFSDRIKREVPQEHSHQQFLTYIFSLGIPLITAPPTLSSTRIIPWGLWMSFSVSWEMPQPQVEQEKSLTLIVSNKLPPTVIFHP